MSTKYLALTIVTAAVLSGCASSQPHLYQGVASSAQMPATPSEKSRKAPFAYTGNLRKLARHTSVSIEPVEVYRGADHQFYRLSQEQIEELSAYARRTFGDALSKGYSHLMPARIRCDFASF